MTPRTDAKTDLQRARAQALMAMVASSMMFAIMGASAKAVTRMGTGAAQIPSAEIACIRYLSGIAALLAISRLRRVNLLGTDRRRLFLRGITGGLSSTLFFLGIQYTSLTNATLLNYTYVIWAPLLAISVLGEPLGRRGIAAVVVALCGVFLVIHPQVGHIRIGDALALLSGLISGMAVVQIRRLRRDETSFAIFFYFNLLGVPISLTTLFLTHTSLVLPGGTQIPLLLLMGASSVGAQLFMTYGYRALTAVQGSLLALTTTVYAALLSYFLFAEPLTRHTLHGALLILLATVAINYRPRS